MEPSRDAGSSDHRMLYFLNNKTGLANVSRIELTDDEVGMLHWLREFPGQAGVEDAAVGSLLDKGLLKIEGGEVFVSHAGLDAMHSE
jgi:hypothetical protein